MNELQQKLEEKVEAISEGLPDLQKRLAKNAMPRLEEEHKQRIFQDGLASDGAPIDSRRSAKEPREGAYSRGHGRRRNEEGLQTSHIDLQFSGRHRRSLISGEDSEGNPAYGFNDSSQTELAAKHEDYREKKIYRPTESEIEELKKVAHSEITDWIKDLFK